MKCKNNVNFLMVSQIIHVGCTFFFKVFLIFQKEKEAGILTTTSVAIIKERFTAFPNLSHSLTFLFLFLVFFSCSLVCSEENSCTAQ